MHGREHRKNLPSTAQFSERYVLSLAAYMHGTCRSLLEQLDDPFTRFLEPSRYAALKRGTAGSLTGVGLEVGFDMGAGKDSDLVVRPAAYPNPGVVYNLRFLPDV